MELQEQYVGFAGMGEGSDGQDGTVHEFADVGLSMGSAPRPY